MRDGKRGAKMVNLDGDWDALGETNLPISDLTYTLPSGGWIYVLETSSDFNRFKLGKTNGNVNGPFPRFGNVHTGDPYMMIKCAFFIPTRLGTARSVEIMLHAGIADLRIMDHYGQPTEWFTQTPNWAVEYIQQKLANFAQQENVGFRSDLPPDLDRVVCIFESDLRQFFGRSDYV